MANMRRICPNCKQQTLPSIRTTIKALFGGRIVCPACCAECQYSRSMLTALTVLDVFLLAVVLALNVDARTQTIQFTFRGFAEIVIVISLTIGLARLLPLKKPSSDAVQANSAYWYLAILVVVGALLMMWRWVFHW